MKKQNLIAEVVTINGIASIVAALALIAFIIGVVGAYKHLTTPCIKTAKVVSIDAITYKGGIVTLDNGDTIDVGQSTQDVRVGSEICVQR